MKLVTTSLVAKLFVAATFILLGLLGNTSQVRTPQPGETVQVVGDGGWVTQPVTPDCRWRTFEDLAQGWDCPWRVSVIGR